MHSWLHVCSFRLDDTVVGVCWIKLRIDSVFDSIGKQTKYRISYIKTFLGYARTSAGRGEVCFCRLLSSN